MTVRICVPDWHGSCNNIGMEDIKNLIKVVRNASVELDKATTKLYLLCASLIGTYCQKTGKKYIEFPHEFRPYFYQDEETMTIEVVHAVRVSDENGIEIVIAPKYKRMRSGHSLSEDYWWFIPGECGVLNYSDLAFALTEFISQKINPNEE